MATIPVDAPSERSLRSRTTRAERWRVGVRDCGRVALICVIAFAVLPVTAQEPEPGTTVVDQTTVNASLQADAIELMASYCFDCHDESSQAGGMDLVGLVERNAFDGHLLFENLVAAKMPPADAEQPTATEKRLIVSWLAERQDELGPNPYRRISRHEFVHSVNDLLATRLNIAETIPEDRGTNAFDSDRRIMLTKEMLAAYFSAADEMIEFAFPANGFPEEQVWTTNKVKDSHHTYNIYARKYQAGMLFSWTRANNGNSYSFFYDNFEPPEKGWYELTFDAAKLGEFEEDVSILVYAGRYYFADDRPQPQRLLGVISLGNRTIKPHTISAFLRPGEYVSVHCYSKHTWRQTEGRQGAYIKCLKVRGPVIEQWPPKSYRKIFDDLPLNAPDRVVKQVSTFKTALQQIGGRITVSSFQQGMEKEKMLDGSNKTFWHTRFKPDVAKPPHYVILENPAKRTITGLSYATWSGGTGNGQVKRYSVYVSDDGHDWDNPIVQGSLEVRLAAEQEILFPSKTRKPFIKFLVTDAVSLDGKSLASIGKIDVIADQAIGSSSHSRTKLTVASSSPDELKRVIKRFAETAFATSLTEDELEPYYQVSLQAFDEDGDFTRATKRGLKAVLCSHRFLLAPGVHPNESFRIAADLARSLWLSVPDTKLLQLAKTDSLSTGTVVAQIDRMLNDPRAQRMIHSFCNQWLNLRSFNKVSPSLKLYPAYNDLLNHYLPLETEAYLSCLINENLPVSYLIDSDFSILNQRLAQHYGMNGVIGQSLRKVSFPPATPRGGLLTMGSVLKVTTDGFDTSPILRGAWISRNIAGNTLSPPPENVNAIEPATNRATTLREQIEEHKNNATCYACHKSIDPYGFALENFDATGQWRTNYRIEKSHPGTFQYRPEGYSELAGEVDASGQIGDARFNDVIGLKKILLKDHKKVAYNVAKRFFEYANGYQPTLKQRIDLYAMIPDQAEDCRMRNLITEVLTYSFIRER